MTTRQWIATPLRAWNLGEVELLTGVRVMKKSSLPDLDIQFFPTVSEHDLELVQKRQYWVTLLTEKPQGEAEAYAIEDRLLQCIDGLQIVRPNGWDGIIVTWTVGNTHPQGPANGLTHFPACEPTKWGRFVGFGTHPLNDILTVIRGVERVFNHKIVRFQTPIQLLVEGLKSRNYIVSFLLWCIALDALLIAEKRDVFERRLVGFLGGDTFVFPFGEHGYQPPYTVSHLASDLYELRGFIAHGYEIPHKFRENVRFDIGDRVVPSANIQWDYQYRQLLSEAALFLLCSVLRRIFELDLIELVRKSKRWKSYLDTGQGAPA